MTDLLPLSKVEREGLQRSGMSTLELRALLTIDELERGLSNIAGQFQLRALKLAALEARQKKLVEALLIAHGKALPANWVYTDSETTIDLLVAEITTLRTELAALREIGEGDSDAVHS